MMNSLASLCVPILVQAYDLEDLAVLIDLIPPRQWAEMVLTLCIIKMLQQFTCDYHIYKELQGSGRLLGKPLQINKPFYLIVSSRVFGTEYIYISEQERYIYDSILQ